MGIGQIVAGVVVIAGATYLNRSGRDIVSGDFLYSEVRKIKRRVHEGDCRGADAIVDALHQDRINLRRQGYLTHDHVRRIRELEKLVDRCYNGESLSGLGDEAAPSRRDRDLRRLTAKKFWGTAVLAIESSNSMEKLSAKIGWWDKAQAERARSLSGRLSTLSQEALDAAQKIDPEWTRGKYDALMLRNKTITQAHEQPQAA